MKTKNMFPMLLIMVGLMLFAVGLVYPLVTAIIDTTAPTFTGYNQCPLNGQTYQAITEVSVEVVDAESGVKSVMYQDTNIGAIDLVLKSGTANQGVWAKTVTGMKSGTYSFTFFATNNAGMQSQLSGTYTIYTNLQGKWYMKDDVATDYTEITSATQVIYLRTLKVYFKFVKTAGVEDSKITCRVINHDTGLTLITLSNTASGTWEGSYPFDKSGKYNLDLDAYDGLSHITLSIFDVGIQYQEVLPTPPLPLAQISLILIGIVFVGYGYYAIKK